MASAISIKIPNKDYKLATFLNETHLSKNILMPFSCDVSEYDEVGIFVYVISYGSSSRTGYARECKIYNIKGE